MGCAVFQGLFGLGRVGPLGRSVLGCLLLTLAAGSLAAQEPSPHQPGPPPGATQSGDPLQLAQHLQTEIPAQRLAEAFLHDPGLVGEALEALAMALMASPSPGTSPSGSSPTSTHPTGAHPTGSYLAALGRQVGLAVAAGGAPPSAEALDLWLTVLLVHPRRFVEEPSFRSRVSQGLPRAWDPAIPVVWRDALLEQLNRVRGVDFDLSERVEVAWGAARRSSATRQTSAEDGVARISNLDPLEATLVSLPSWDFEPSAAERFLAALEAQTQGTRDLLILADGPMLDALASGARGPRTFLLPSHGRNYSPWPRDPLLVARRADGGVELVGRPNPQAGREDDDQLGRELIQQLPDAVDARWRLPRWRTAEAPFHHGQMLLTDEAVWVSLHTLEAPTLERLGLDRVPVESFARVDGVQRYLEAARAAAADLGRLVGRPVRWVHGLPTGGEAAVQQQSLLRLGGGAGWDLDSLLTLIPGDGGKGVALVGDLDRGLALFQDLPNQDLQAFARTYNLRLPPEALVARLVDDQGSPRPRGLDGFLEAVAEHLDDEGWRVERLPLLWVPTNLLADGGATHEHRDFLVGWNNVVLETTPVGLRAEGFAAGVPAADDHARQLFARAGVQLDLLPPLVASIVRNGGYRCATNHVRALPVASQQEAP